MDDEFQVELGPVLEALLKQQNQQLEHASPAKFTKKFTGENLETMSWVFAANTFLRINRFKSAKVKFNKIFESLDQYYQNRYMMHYSDETKDEENLTWDKLKAWIINEYPPPPAKFQFRARLKQMTMRLNEDPNIAYARFTYKCEHITQAIKAINAAIDDVNKHVKELSDEDKLDALTGMFVRKNNSLQYKNRGNINKLVRDKIIKEDPQNVRAWTDLFGIIKTSLISSQLRGLKDYQYITYPPRQEDDALYFTKKKKSVDSTHDRQQPHFSKTDKNRFNKTYKRGRRSQHDQSRNHNHHQPPQKRQRRGKTSCHRCGKSGHISTDCYAKYDVNQNLISSPPNKSPPNKNQSRKYCTYCKHYTHNTSECKKQPRRGNKHHQQFSQYAHNSQNNNNSHIPSNPELNFVQQQHHQPHQNHVHPDRQQHVPQAFPLQSSNDVNKEIARILDDPQYNNMSSSLNAELRRIISSSHARQ